MNDSMQLQLLGIPHLYPNVEAPLEYLYVVEILGFGVKIGVTRKPLQRMRSTFSTVTGLGYEVGYIWWSCPHETARQTERQLIENGREYLPKVSWLVMVRKALQFTEAMPV